MTGCGLFDCFQTGCHLETLIFAEALTSCYCNAVTKPTNPCCRVKEMVEKQRDLYNKSITITRLWLWLWRWCSCKAASSHWSFCSLLMMRCIIKSTHLSLSQFLFLFCFCFFGCHYHTAAAAASQRPDIATFLVLRQWQRHSYDPHMFWVNWGHSLRYNLIL